MDHLTARPQLLKQLNLSFIRKSIKNRGSATRAEIAQDTKISSTTIRSLLNELLENQELESIGYDQSSGGRKAERYRFQPERYCCVAICISGNQLHTLLINIYGKIIETHIYHVTDDNYEQIIFPFLDELVTKREIKAIGLGVPGIVEGRNYWKKHLDQDNLFKINIGDHLFSRYGIPVLLENDIKAIALGFAQCYQKEFPDTKPEDVNMAFVYFDTASISAGFITEGRIIRGFHDFSGELGLIPMEQYQLLDASLAEPMDDNQYSHLVTQVLSWICAILNPEYIALGGPALRIDCIATISNLLYSLLPNQMMAEILYSEDIWCDYYHGMAFLTSNKIFDDIQLTKE